MSHAYVARQMIVDREERLCGFDLFFRQSRVNRAAVADAEQASASVISAAVNGFDVQALLQGVSGFVLITPGMLYDEALKAVPAEHFIFTVVLSELQAAHWPLIEQMHQAGARFALVLESFGAIDADRAALFEWFKVSVDGLDEEALAQLKAQAGTLLKRSIAQKIEKRALFEQCRALGFGAFGGFFFAKAEVVQGERLSASKMAILELIEKLSGDAELSIAKKRLERDPELSIALLRYCSSAAFSTRAPVKTIQQAITLLGRAGVLQWLMLMLYGADTEGGHHALAQMALLRARIMQQMAKELGKPELSESAYAVGMLSLLDAMLKRPMNEILDAARFDESLREALLHHKGPLGGLLIIAIRIERGEFTQLEGWLKKMGKNIDLLSRVLSKSYAWVAQS
jgi:EAL and modified HD-GYP domain-containing signal transduction protein